MIQKIKKQSHLDTVPVNQTELNSFDELINCLNEYEKIKPNLFIKDYFKNILNDIYIYQNELIKEINDKSDETISILKEKEIELRSNATKLNKTNIENFKLDNLTFWKQLIRKPFLTQIDLNFISLELRLNLTYVQNEFKKYKNSLLMNETIYFDQNENRRYSFSNISFNSINSDQLIRKFDQTFTMSISSIREDETSNKLMIAFDHKFINFWSLESGKKIDKINIEIYFKHKTVYNILMMPNDKCITVSYDNSIKLWDLNSNKCIKTIKNSCIIDSLCSLPNDVIACGCRNGYIKIINLVYSNKIKPFKAHHKPISYLLADDSRKIMISCCGDSKIKIWNSITFLNLKILEENSSDILYLDLTLDGYLLSFSQDKTFKLWSLQTGDALNSIEINFDFLNLKAIRKDLIALCCQGFKEDEYLIQIFSLSENRIVKQMTAHTSLIYHFHLLSNGDLLSITQDDGMKQWKIFN